MKRLISPLGVLLLSGVLCAHAYGQTPANALESKKEHTELIAVFGQNWVDNNPVMVDALEACKLTRISYLQEPITENGKYPLLSSFPLMNKNNPGVVAIDFATFDPQTFNPFTYNLEFLSDKIQVIRVDGTPWIMVIQRVER